MSDHEAAPPASAPGDTPPPPPPPPPSFRLLRSRSDRKLGGVAGGFAAATGLDPTLVRVALVVGALTGWVILVYLVAWAALPEEDPAAGRPLVPASEDTARLLRIGLAVVAGLGALQLAGMVAAFAFALLGGLRMAFHPFVDPFAGNFGGINPDFPVRGFVGLALLVAGAAFLLWHRSRPAAPAPPSTLLATPADPAAGPTTPAGPPAGPTTPAGPPAGPSAPPLPATPGRPGAPPPVPPPPPGVSPASGRPGVAGGERRGGDWLLVAARAAAWLVALWFAAAVAAVTILWAFDAIRLRFPLLAAVATLAAFGLLGAALARARRPALLAGAAAALVVPITLTLFLARWNGAAGYRSVVPSTAAELDPTYRHAAGILRLDLTDLRLPPGVTQVSIRMGMGEVQITVPWDAHVEASSRIGAGEFRMFGRSQTGLSLQSQVRSEGEPGGPSLQVATRASAGKIKVFRGEPPATKVALDAGEPVYLDCRFDPAGLRCQPPDRFPTPRMDCLVSPDWMTLCRPSGEPLPDDVAWAGQPGTRLCTVPPGGGVATCAEGAPPEAPAAPMPPGTYLCEFPPDGGPATCRPA